MPEHIDEKRRRQTAQRPGAGLIITVDVEDHGISPAKPRIDQAIGPLLEVLEARRVKATFFVVGELVSQWDHQLRELVAAGHEIGLHGFTHRRLEALGPAAFSEELRMGVDTLGEYVGISPDGYRAPFCSMTRNTPWAPDLIKEAGFSYSSSVVPAWNPMAGYPGAPRQPFLWPCGLLELPSPVFGIGKMALPVLGGAYLRLMPSLIVQLAKRRRSADRGAWTYVHPYDLDTTEQFYRRSGQSWIEARLMFARRKHMFDRVTRFAVAGSPTLGDYAAKLIASRELRVFL